MANMAVVYQSKKFKLMLLGVVLVVYGITYVLTKDPMVFKQYGYKGIFLFNIFGPGVTLLPFLVSKSNILLVVGVSALGSLISDSMMWVVGKQGEAVLVKSKKTEWLEKTYASSIGPVVVYALAVIPFPFSTVSLSAGYANFPFTKYASSVLLGRFTRYLIVALVILWLGNLNWLKSVGYPWW